MRTPRWELHILPMMRMIDHDHMIRLPAPRGLNLFDYDQVRARSVRNSKGRSPFLDNIKTGHMPPPDVGGPWPEEWIALYERWIDAGFPRLAKAAGTYTATRSGDDVVLKASVELPSVEDTTWLDRASMSESPREYNLWYEPSGNQDGPFPTEAIERFKAPPSVTVVVVIDANGRQEVEIR